MFALDAIVMRMAPSSFPVRTARFGIQLSFYCFPSQDNSNSFKANGYSCRLKSYPKNFGSFCRFSRSNIEVYFIKYDKIQSNASLESCKCEKINQM